MSLGSFGGSASRMITPESSRSSAASSAVTSSLLFVEPHGVKRPNDLRYHCLKSASPTFAASLPSWSYTQWRGNTLAPVSSYSLEPSALIVSESVVHTSGARNCTNGGAGRGGGKCGGGRP